MIGPGRKGGGGNDRACVQKNIGADGGKAKALVCERANVFEKNGNVVVGVRLRIAARARAKKDDTLNTVAIDFGYGGAEAGQYRIVERFFRHCVSIVAQKQECVSPVPFVAYFT